jgi:hypothetical protein
MRKKFMSNCCFTKQACIAKKLNNLNMFCKGLECNLRDKIKTKKSQR